MMRSFLNYKRRISFLLLLGILNSVVSPTAALALTSGPAQPEAASFTPVGTSDMVNLFTGDFNYNIPLLDVGGYPVNISYTGGSFMDQEASWVGLGWNINAGAVNRNMRGLPDDFNGDEVKKEMNMKANETYGVTVGVGGEMFGIDAVKANFSLGVTYNTYTGYGISHSVGLDVVPVDGFPGTIGLGLCSGSDGLTISPKLSFKAKLDKQNDETLYGSVSLGTSFNSRTGMKAVSLNAGLSSSSPKKDPEVKAKNSTSGLSKSATYDLGAFTHVPQSSMPMHNTSFLYSFALGGTALGGDLTANVTGNYSKQSLQYKSTSIPAYGYMYQEHGEDLDQALLDFNREKDGPFSENSMNLPVTSSTYDVYNVAGQGVGGSYRLFRGDIGYVFDSRATTDSENDALSGDLSLGQTVQGGINYYNTITEQSSGKWTDNNSMANRFHFRSKTKGDLYEPAYFKEAGEMTIEEDDLYTAVQGNTPIRFDIGAAGFETYTLPRLAIASGISVAAPTDNKRTKRAKRNQLLTYVTKKEYKAGALDRSLYSLIPGTVPDHHVAEISTTKTDGTRYVYGLPVFNTKQVEKSFNVSGNSVSSSIVSVGGTDDTPDNQKGIDNFYSSTELPPFAYSYLITAVLSPDYVDVSGDGPTEDDLGTYTKFEYETPYAYNWRTPFVAGATFEEGLKTDPNDNKGSYVYGEKQITYLKRIVTKNHIAVFNLQNRKDGRGVTGMQGGSLGAYQKLLESIQLFSAPDYYANISNLANATVIKQVNFVYDYSLCQNGTNVPNNGGGSPVSPYESANQGGKLTLKKIYFTYGKSKKGHLSPYEFTYATLALDAAHSNITPSYDPRAYDRWGTYKPTTLSGLPNNEYPYVEQDKATADSYAGLWNLREITLPSGGKIQVELESDDYAYVQNKRAAQMFKIVGSDNSIPSNPYGASIPSNNLLYGSGSNYTTLYFKLSEPINYGVPNGIAAANTIFQREYMSGIEDLYFRFLTNVNGTTLSPGYEYVSGYATIMSSGVVSSASAPAFHADYGWIQLNTVNRGDKGGSFTHQENPISKATWQFGRMHTPKAVFSANGQPADPSGDVSGFMKAMADASFLKNTVEFFKGMYGTMKAPPKEYGKYFQKGKSWIRLNNPKRNKLGGGNRVKTLKISDEWSSMIAPGANNASKTFEYGQQYSYTTDDAETGYEVSSGVAAYEPSFGADENPCRYPIYNPNKKDELLLAPDNNLYEEGPYGESFYPNATIGYSRITVSNLPHPNVTSNGTGTIIHEFYTAKDFPVKSGSPGKMYIKRQRSNALQKIISTNFKDHLTASQGYCIETNDMHGKQKGMSVFDAKKNKISAVTYFYRMDESGALNNVAPVMTKTGAITNRAIGVDFDMVADFREQKTVTETTGLQGNLYFIMAGVFPFMVPPIIPSSKKESVRFRSAGITKVIQRFGILERTVAEDLGSVVETSNLLWDGETGQVLLTNTNTEFRDAIYNFNYPGYFAYSGMEPAYKNVNLEFDLGAIANSSPGPDYGKVNQNYKQYLEAGDEFIVIDNTSGAGIGQSTSSTHDSKCWVRKQGNEYYLIDRTGGIIYANSTITGTNYTLKLIRSGKRNQQATSAGHLVTFNSPVDLSFPSSAWPKIDGTSRVLNASASEFGNTWKSVCECGINPVGSSANEYLTGAAGVFRPKKAYAYLTMRKQTEINNNSNIRKDGVFEKFDAFWTPNAGADWLKPSNLSQPDAKWTWTSEVTEYSPYGTELENKDALNRYSAAIYGYNNSLPVAVGANTRYRQMASDNFEDYGFGCSGSEGHFSFKSSTQTPMTYLTIAPNYQKFAHSGRKSIKVAAGQQPVKVTKDIQPCQ